VSATTLSHLCEAATATAREWWRGTSNIALWGTLAWYDITLRYRRSIIGPFWITISTGFLLLGMGPLYAGLFNQPLNRFFPHLALGIIFWGFFTSTIYDGCNTFITGATYLKQPNFPASALVWRGLARNVIQLAHTILIYVPLMMWADVHVTGSIFLLPVTFLLVIANLHAITLSLGILTARFRDVSQIVASALNLLMFLTPVFWFPEDLPDRARFVLYNPFAVILTSVRGPLLGNTPTPGELSALLMITVMNVVAAAILYHMKRRSLVYWI